MIITNEAKPKFIVVKITKYLKKCKDKRPKFVKYGLGCPM